MDEIEIEKEGKEEQTGFVEARGREVGLKGQTGSCGMAKHSQMKGLLPASSINILSGRPPALDRVSNRPPALDRM